MKMKFNKDKSLKLLKKRKSLQKEGKLLWDYIEYEFNTNNYFVGMLLFHNSDIVTKN